MNRDIEMETPMTVGNSECSVNENAMVNGDESPQDAQDGVRDIEAISMTWTKWGLLTAYFSLFLMAFATSLEGQVTYSVLAFATSSFHTHSLISTVYVVQGVVNAVIKPPMAKIADVFGRLEAFSISILFYVLGYLQMACSRDVQTFVSAQIFYSAGFTGLQILQQVFIADTSSLLNRALFSSLPDLPFLATVWIGSLIGAAIIAVSTWRWAYGVWAVILPVAFLPLALTLFLNGRRARMSGLVPAKKLREGWALAVVKKTVFDLDVGGIVLLGAAFALTLIPLTLASSAAWSNPSIIAMIVVGFVLLVAFPFWEASPKLAPHPLIPLNLLKSRTFCAGCGVSFFYFVVYYLSVQPYFYSYLMVVQNQPILTAGHITQTFSFTATITSVLVSLLIKYTKHYKWFVTTGSLVYLLGIGLMIRYRAESNTVATLVGCQIALGVGGGMLNVPAQLGVQASVSHQQVAAATAAFLTVLEIGGAVGAAISGAVWGRLVPAKLAAYLPDGAKGDAGAIYGAVTKAVSYPVGSAERTAINRAYQEAIGVLFIIAVCMCVPLVVCSLLMRDYNLDSVEGQVKGWVIGGEAGAGGQGQGQKTEHKSGAGIGQVSGGGNKGRMWNVKSLFKTRVAVDGKTAAAK